MEHEYQILDERFRNLILNPSTVHIEKLWSDGRWTEGPTYFPAHRALIWSDIPNNRMLRWTETGLTETFRTPSNYSNGNTVDRQGRLISCEHGARRITRTEHNGSITVLADSYQGKRLNSPNDVVVKSDGSIWFSDPPYGILSDYEGGRAKQEQAACYVYCLNPQTGTLRVVADDFIKPNGLAFSPDEHYLYIADTARSHDPDGPAHIRRFEVTDGNLHGGEIFATCDAGLFDGFRLDETGNLWSSAGDGVHCYAPDGTLLGKILIPEIVSNVCFGGSLRTRLFITATTSLYAVYVAARGQATF
ncbi:MAG: SMP-30/gluconolactonase/LRE family protein [Gammaproteobacteria bacterium]